MIDSRNGGRGLELSGTEVHNPAIVVQTRTRVFPQLFIRLDVAPRHLTHSRAVQVEASGRGLA